MYTASVVFSSGSIDQIRGNWSPQNARSSGRIRCSDTFGLSRSLFSMPICSPMINEVFSSGCGMMIGGCTSSMTKGSTEGRGVAPRPSARRSASFWKSAHLCVLRCWAALVFVVTGGAPSGGCQPDFLPDSSLSPGSSAGSGSTAPGQTTSPPSAGTSTSTVSRSSPSSTASAEA
jgi:hypothetical protein